MRKLILASVAVLGFAGVAAAQEAPALIYGQAAQNISNHDGAAVDYRATTASVSKNAPTSSSPTTAAPTLLDINQNPNYSGR